MGSSNWTSTPESAATNAINNVVRYILYNAGNGQLISRSAITEKVLKNSQIKFNKILPKVNEILTEVYGYELKLLDETSSSKSYVVSNVLSNLTLNLECLDQNYVPEGIDKIVFFLILTHIFMSNNCVAEESIENMLRLFDIDIVQVHPIYGDVKKIIKQMITQKYIHKNSENNVQMYSWGVRAEMEVSKLEILKFVSKMYGNNVENWEMQVKEAGKQTI